METKELSELVDEEFVTLIESYSNDCSQWTDFTWVDGSRLHEFMVSGGMWMSEEGFALCGRGVQTPEGKHFSNDRFFYYMGAENEATIDIKIGNELVLYTGISEERVERYFDNLLSKEWYGQFSWEEPDDLPYWWPSKEIEKVESTVNNNLPDELEV